MGLDMYLYRVRYVKAWDHQPPEKRPEVTLTIGGTVVPLIRPAYIKEEVMYWRKENGIHAWFVRECAGGKDECQPTYVSAEKLRELLGIMKKIMATPASRRDAKAAELLPTQDGFFFGGTEYDEWYYNGLRETITVFEALLADEAAPEYDAYEYQASW